MATTMSIEARDASMVDALMTLMKPLKQNVKVYIAEKLLAIVSEENEADNKMELFNKVKGAWKCDSLTADEEIAVLRDARTQGVTRVMENL